MSQLKLFDSVLHEFDIGDRMKIGFGGKSVTGIVISKRRVIRELSEPHSYTVYVEETDGQRWSLRTNAEEDDVKLRFAVGESSGERPALDSVEWETRGVVDNIEFLENAKDDSRVPSRFK